MLVTPNNQPTEDRYDPVHDDGRRLSSATVAFLGTGMDPKPTRANMVDRLSRCDPDSARTERPAAAARRLACGRNADPGIQENAALLAVLEISELASALPRRTRSDTPDPLARTD
jgi:hypothetical protein